MKERKLRTRPVILSGEYSLPFAERVASHLDLPVTPTTVTHFANTEINAHIEESVRDATVFAIQSHGAPVNDNLMEHLAIVQAAQLGSAHEVTAIAPYRGYGRADRMAKPHDAFMGKLSMQFFELAHARRFIEVDPHSGQSSGFANGMLYESIPAAPVLRDDIARVMATLDKEPVIVSPDFGRDKLNERYAALLGGLDLAVIAKNRDGVNHVNVQRVIGEVAGKVCFMIDDMIDTGGTIVKGAQALRDRGAAAVYIYTTHPIFSDPAGERLSKAVADGVIEEVVTTDTLRIPDSFEPGVVRTVSVAPLVAAAITKIYHGESVSGYFNGETHH